MTMTAQMRFMAAALRAVRFAQARFARERPHL